MLPRAVLFDLDGTLVDSLRELAHAANATAERFGQPPAPLELVRTRIGHGARALVEQSLGGVGRLDEAMDAFYAAYTKVLHRSAPFPGLVPLLERLGAAGVARGLATNKPAAFTGPLLRAAGLERHLEGWASGDEAERKPSPATLQLALTRAGLAPRPEEVVYVGDMPVDVEAARRFGCRAIAVGWGLDPEGARASGPDAWADDPEALAAALGLD